MLKRLFPDPFLLLILATVAAASLWPPGPNGAVLVSATSSAAIFLLFFLHGAKIPAHVIVGAFAYWKLHALVLVFTFVLFPLAALALKFAAPAALSQPLWLGVIFMCALPSTVQSSIAFTSIAGGNTAAAVAAASLSQILGVMLTPLLVGALAGQRVHIDAAGFVSVAMQILVPFLLGQIARRWISAWIDRHKAKILLTDRATILLAVFSAFSASARDGIWQRFDLRELGGVTFICLALLALALWFTYLTGKAAGLPRGDRIVLQFCGTKKSLVQGVPMARVLFPGPAAGVVLLPIMIFHQLQLMACAWIAAHYAQSTPEAAETRATRH